MFLHFFLELKAAGVPVTLREYLTLLEAMRAGLAAYDVEAFYYLARAALVKDERFIDRFDRVFGHVFRGIEAVSGEGGVAVRDLPEEWLRRLAEKHLSAEEKALVAALGGFERLMETLKQRLAEQQGRHQGGSKWIGTAGTSPFGAHGYNPEGVRIGQERSRHRRAVKVWDERTFRDLDGEAELGTRAIKVALKRLRRWVREGAAEELDLDGTIRSTARTGTLDVRTRPERRNAVRLLMFFDIGGSMDDHVLTVEQLFSAARSEFGAMRHFYFHNCLYETVWTDNRRRRQATTPTLDLIRSFGPDTKVVFVGDAAMSPYEIVQPGGSVEHWNAEAGSVWLTRMREHFPRSVWINPTPENDWEHTRSIGLVRGLIEGRMYPLTLSGLDAAMRALSR